MALFKFLICSFVILSSVSDGWFPVEKTPQPTEQNEDDPSIWALFSKSLGDEKFLVRLPGDPVYQYSGSGDFELSSEKEGERFLLTVEENGEGEGDLLYQSEDKWVHEHYVKSGSHLYHFRTLSNTSDSTNHKAFISSFLIEKNS